MSASVRAYCSAFVAPAARFALVLALASCVEPLKAPSVEDAVPAPSGDDTLVASARGEACARDLDVPSVGLETTTHIYVSNLGDDVSGKGTRLAPWRTLGRALAAASSPEDADVPVGPSVHVAPGTYVEIVRVGRSLRLGRDDFEGQGGEVTLQSPVAGPYVLTVWGDVTAVLEGLTIDGNKLRNPGIHVHGARVRLEDVSVLTPSVRGILIEDSPAFAVLDSEVTNAGLLLWADFALDIQSSRGIIDGLVAGDRFDHVVNVGGQDSALVISRSELTGSPIHYADGIRVQSAADVRIDHNRIVRRPDAEGFDAGSIHNPPYAGIELAMASEAGKCVWLTDNEVRGFDAGIGINMAGNALLAEGNALIDNLRDQVRVMWQGTDEPVIDFGGGAIGSAGDNALLGGDFAFVHAGPFEVAAGNGVWGGDPASRIWDAADAEELGAVRFLAGDSSAAMHDNP